MKGLRAGLARLMGLAACLVPSLLLSWALTAGILGFWHIDLSLLQLLAPCCLWVILFALGFTNGRTALILLAAAVAAALIGLFSGGISALAEVFVQPGPSLAWVVSCPLAALVVGLSRRRVMLPPLIILTGGVFALLAIVQLPPTLAEAALACVALVAYTARSALHRWSGVSSASSEGQLALWVLPVAGLLALACWALVLPHAQLPKVDALADKLDFLNAYLMDLAGHTDPRTSFSLVPTGMQPDPQQLGGPVELRDDEVLSVTASDPGVLLRGAVYSDYNGHTWYNAQASTRYKLSDGARLSSVFNTGLPPEGDLACEELSVSVTHLADGPASLFVPFRLDTLTPSELMSLLVYFNDRGEVFATRDIEAGRGYSLQATLPTTDLSQISQWMAAHSGLQDEGYDAAASAYLGLPDTLPESVGEVARQLAGDAANDAEAVLRLAQYLSANTTYSLTPLVPPADEDFVAYFLETKTGYCTYYASAMAVLCRSLGIPARYVEGYQLPEGTQAGETVTVTQRQAHAWCEVYFKGIGWIPVDVSAQDGASPEPGADADDTVDTQPEPTPEPTPYTPQEAEPTPTPDDPLQPPAAFPWRPLLLSLMTLLVLAALVFGPPLYRAQREKQACRTLSGALACHYQAILRLLGFVGLSPQSGETLAQFAARVDETMPMRRVSAGDVARVIMDRTYGPNAEPTDRDVQTLALYRARLDRAIRVGRGWWFYTLRERLRWKR